MSAIGRGVLDYSRAVLHRWYFMVIGLFGGLASVVNDLFGRSDTAELLPSGEVQVVEHPLVPTWLWVSVFLLGLFIAQVWAWFDLRNDRPMMRSSAPSEHVAKVKATAAAVHKTVKATGQQDLTTAQSAALLAHLPELRWPLEQWNAAVTASETARRNFKEWLTAHLDEAGFGAEPFTEAGRKLVETKFYEDAVRVVCQEDVSQRFQFQFMSWENQEVDNGPLGWIVVMPMQGAWSNQNHLVQGLQRDDVQPWIDRLHEAFVEAYRSRTASEVAQADAVRETLRGPLLDELAGVQERFDFIANAWPDCPHCPPLHVQVVA